MPTKAQLEARIKELEQALQESRTDRAVLATYAYQLETEIRLTKEQAKALAEYNQKTLLLAQRQSTLQALKAQLETHPKPK